MVLTVVVVVLATAAVDALVTAVVVVLVTAAVDALVMAVVVVPVTVAVAVILVTVAVIVVLVGDVGDVNLQYTRVLFIRSSSLFLLHRSLSLHQYVWMLFGCDSLTRVH